MIAGIFHQGSGIGNQLFRYVTTRVLALDKGYEFGMCNPENFKGSSFMNLGLAEMPVFMGAPGEFIEKKVVEGGIDIRGYDPEINFVKDNTIIEGEFQDERYWGHRLDDIREWLEVEPLEMSDDLCIINFRGGEYMSDLNLFLTKDYWDQAIQMMNDKYKTTYEWGSASKMRYEVHTDDPDTAKLFFPDFKVIDNRMLTADKRYESVGYNWRAIRYAKHLIISNSSFPILPALLNEDVKEVIAPRYWARHNIKLWAQPSNYYKKFTYI